LFKRSFERLNFSSPYDINADQCIKEGRFSAQTHIASLGKFFRSDAAGLKKVKTPYLKADQALTHQLRQKIAQKDRIVCGIAWRSKNAEFGADKSITLEALVPLLSTQGVEFVDLQYGDTAAERAALKQQHDIPINKLEEIDNLNDIDGLAALISACDIVITISNVTAHIASALGKPTLVMLPNSTSLFWYWHRERTDSPWYPSAVLIRQASPGEWQDVIDIARSALQEFKTGLTQ
jgi:ADP-heptose:LPS heptosyltransferase